VILQTATRQCSPWQTVCSCRPIHRCGTCWFQKFSDVSVEMDISRSICATACCYIKCVVCDKLLKLRQSFRITLYLVRNVERDNTAWTVVRSAYYLVWHDEKHVVFTTSLPIYNFPTDLQLPYRFTTDLPIYNLPTDLQPTYLPTDLQLTYRFTTSLPIYNLPTDLQHTYRFTT
jgi:hypothetical protein